MNASNSASFAGVKIPPSLVQVTSKLCLAAQVGDDLLGVAQLVRRLPLDRRVLEARRLGEEQQLALGRERRPPPRPAGTEPAPAPPRRRPSEPESRDDSSWERFLRERRGRSDGLATASIPLVRMPIKGGGKCPGGVWGAGVVAGGLSVDLVRRQTRRRRAHLPGIPGIPSRSSRPSKVCLGFLFLSQGFPPPGRRGDSARRVAARMRFQRTGNHAFKATSAPISAPPISARSRLKRRRPSRRTAAKRKPTRCCRGP